jgi:hypothetical protein
MARPLRIEYEGAWYHVINRGRRAEKIFLEKQDCRMFIELPRERDVRAERVLILKNQANLLHYDTCNLTAG